MTWVIRFMSIYYGLRLDYDHDLELYDWLRERIPVRMGLFENECSSDEQQKRVKEKQGG